jgi:hypothetical protein
MVGSTPPSWPTGQVALLKQAAADADALCMEATDREVM